MKRDVKTVAAVTGAAALLGTGLYLAVPAFATAPQGATTQATPTKDPAKRHVRRAWRRGVHGEATVRKQDGFGKVAWQRGQITAISGSTLTVRSADGATWQWSTNGDTRFRKNRAKSALKALAVQDWAVVFGPVDGSTRTARAVVVRAR